MKRFGEINEKPVLSLKDFCIIGKITDCVMRLEQNKIAYFLCRQNDYDFLLPFDTVQSVKDAVVVADRTRNLDPLDVDFTLHTSLLQKETYQRDGAFLGKVADVFFDQKGVVSSFKIGEDTLKPSMVEGIDQIILVKSPLKRKYKRKSSDVTALGTVDTPVKALDDESSMSMASSFSDLNSTLTVEDGVDKQEIPPAYPPSKTSPSRIIADYNFLLGRTLQEDLYTYDGRLIAKRGASVTVDMVEASRLNGKLLELTLNSK